MAEKEFNFFFKINVEFNQTHDTTMSTKWTGPLFFFYSTKMVTVTCHSKVTPLQHILKSP